MKRLEFVLERIGKGIVVLIGILILNFILIRVAPGDPASVMAGEAGTGDAIFMQQLREQFGLDKSLIEQLWIYLKNAAFLDLGFSYRQQRPVADILFERLPATLLLTGTAYVLSLAAGIVLGILAAAQAGRWTDSVVTVFALFFYATPLFWVGLMGILIFSVTLDWLPSYGMYSIGARLSGLDYVADIARHLVLPASTLALFHMAFYARMTRASMLEIRDLDFVRTARSKGTSESRVVTVHILRNAILPVLTMAGVKAGTLVGGSVVIETVFAWPGIGRIAFDAVLQRDYNVLLGVFFVTSVMVIFFNIVTDILYSLVDPRIEVGS